MNKKGGRPTVEKKRTTQIKFHLNEEEYAYFLKKYKDSIYSNRAEMLRDIFLNNTYRTITVDNKLQSEYDLLIHQSKKIGNNINQLVKLLHSKKLNYISETDFKVVKDHIIICSNMLKKIESL